MLDSGEYSRQGAIKADRDDRGAIRRKSMRKDRVRNFENVRNVSRKEADDENKDQKLRKDLPYRLVLVCLFGNLKSRPASPPKGRSESRD